MIKVTWKYDCSPKLPLELYEWLNGLIVDFFDDMYCKWKTSKSELRKIGYIEEKGVTSTWLMLTDCCEA